MSQLVVSAPGQQDFYLNVLSFTSPIFGEMNSAQTRTQVQYFPIKAFQPELVCDVIFPNERQWEAWQRWARLFQLNAQNTNTVNGSGGLRLNWPRRGINNWTAVIGSAKAGGMRRNFTPRVRIEFQLIVSLVSTLDVFQSFASGWQGLLGVGANLSGLFALPANVQGGAVTPANNPVNAVVNSPSLGSLIPGLGLG